MSKKSTPKEIGKLLLSANSALLFPHVHADGDALGSSVALCRALRNQNKKAYVLIEDKIPEYLRFLDEGYCTEDLEIIESPDLCICVDCSDYERFPLRKSAFLRGKKTACIDHHLTSRYLADENLIDGSAAATAELVFAVLTEAEIPIDKQIGEAIYTAIATDTGNFQYSNTTAKTHRIATALYEVGIAANDVSRKLYQNMRMEKLLISGKILSNLKRLMEGQVAICYVTQDMLREAGALMEDTEGMAETLRNIGGVELSVFAKEMSPTEVKFSMRSKSWVDVSQMAAMHNGGGHARAAGFTLHMPLSGALVQVEREIEAYFKEKCFRYD